MLLEVLIPFVILGGFCIYMAVRLNKAETLIDNIKNSHESMKLRELVETSNKTLTNLENTSRRLIEGFHSDFTKAVADVAGEKRKEINSTMEDATKLVTELKAKVADLANESKELEEIRKKLADRDILMKSKLREFKTEVFMDSDDTEHEEASKILNSKMKEFTDAGYEILQANHTRGRHESGTAHYVTIVYAKPE